jgi:hypothetical protein
MVVCVWVRARRAMTWGVRAGLVALGVDVLERALLPRLHAIGERVLAAMEAAEADTANGGAGGLAYVEAKTAYVACTVRACACACVGGWACRVGLRRVGVAQRAAGAVQRAGGGRVGAASGAAPLWWS